jgi:antitoxin PrlF
MNSALHAMRLLQREMEGEAEKAGLRNDDDVMEVVKEVRIEF